MFHCVVRFVVLLADSGEEGFHHTAVHLREAVIAAAVTEGKAFVVEAQLVEDGGVDVVDVDGIDDGVGSFISGPPITSGGAPTFGASVFHTVTFPRPSS